MQTTIGLDSVLCKIIESMLPTGTKDKCLVITINIRKDNHKKDTFERERFNIIVYRPYSYTYIGETTRDDSTYYFNDENVELKQHSYHSSCWRNDGIHDCIKEHQIALDSRTLKTDSQFVDIETIKLVDGFVDIENNMFIKQ